jgi:hypothetical protein
MKAENIQAGDIDTAEGFYQFIFPLGNLSKVKVWTAMAYDSTRPWVFAVLNSSIDTIGSNRAWIDGGFMAKGHGFFLAEPRIVVARYVYIQVYNVQVGDNLYATLDWERLGAQNVPGPGPDPENKTGWGNLIW